MWDLTPRQMLVFKSIITQEPGHITCDRLQISNKTLETHKRNVRDKLGVDTNYELIQLTLQTGVIEFNLPNL